jgi:ankyrin repeat protein
MTRQIDIIDDLLARGADVNARRQDGALPIHLTNGDYHYRGWRDVPEDVVTTPDDVYRHLVARGVNVDIGMAAVKGDLERVRELLDQDPQLANRVSEYGSYYLGCGAPLKNAAAGGHIEIVKLLLDYGADPNLPEEGIAPRGHSLYSAVYNGHYEIAKLLLEHGAYPNPEVESSADAVFIAITPLHQFAERGDIESAALFIDRGADLQAREEEFCSTPLAWAANFGQTRMVEFLLRRGAKPNLPDDPPWATPLAWATRRGHHDIVRILTKYEQSGALSAHSLEEYETLANDLIEAYGSGEEAAFLRVLDLFQIKRPLTWDRPPLHERLARFRRFVRERLDRRSESGNESDTLTLADARLLVARAHGFESWAELTKHTEG